MSGSYLVAEDGGPRNRTGGISVSLSSPDGHVVGGSVAMLVAASLVQVLHIYQSFASTWETCSTCELCIDSFLYHEMVSHGVHKRIILHFSC